MNRFWLKIIACMVLIFAAVVLGYVFWPQGKGQAPERQAVGPALDESQNTARLGPSEVTGPGPGGEAQVIAGKTYVHERWSN